MAKSNAEKQRAAAARRKAQGLVQCNVWVPEEMRAELVELAEMLKWMPHLSVEGGSLRDRNTGTCFGFKRLRRQLREMQAAARLAERAPILAGIAERGGSIGGEA